MAFTSRGNVLIFTAGTEVLDPAAFADRLHVKALKWVVTAGAATAGTSQAYITDSTSGTRLWEAVATGTNVDLWNDATCLEFQAKGGGSINVVVDVGTLYLYV